MWTTLRISCAIVLLMTTSVGFAVDYPYKKLDDFRTLEFFKNIDDFESSYEKYARDCLANTFGGSAGVPCYMSYEIWDRELNISYNKLMKTLGEKEKNNLKASQFAWIKERDKTINFNYSLLDKKYTATGTMYVLMRAGDADVINGLIVKQRVILLKKWLELINIKY